MSQLIWYSLLTGHVPHQGCINISLEPDSFPVDLYNSKHPLNIIAYLFATFFNQQLIVMIITMDG